MSKLFKLKVDLTKYDVRIESFTALLADNRGPFGSISNWARELNTALDDEDAYIIFTLESERQVRRLAFLLENFGFTHITKITEEEFNA